MFTFRQAYLITYWLDVSSLIFQLMCYVDGGSLFVAFAEQHISSVISHLFVASISFCRSMTMKSLVLDAVFHGSKRTADVYGLTQVLYLRDPFNTTLWFM